MDRRQFLATGAAALPLRAAAHQQATAQPQAAATPATWEDIKFTRRDLPFKARPSPMTAVRLTDGPFKVVQELNRQYLHRLSADRLLHNFRLAAGLPSTAEPLGGWEEPKGELRGHFVGHYLTACALY